MRYSDLISGVVWLALGVLLTLWSIRYNVGSVINPGPGFLPLLLGILLILLSLILLKQVRKSRSIKKARSPLTLPIGWKKLSCTVLILLAATFTFETIGYLLTVFFLMILLMLVAELGGWKKIFLIAILTALGVYVVFVLWLEQPLPVGFLRI